MCSAPSCSHCTTITISAIEVDKLITKLIDQMAVRSVADRKLSLDDNFLSRRTYRLGSLGT